MRRNYQKTAKNEKHSTRIPAESTRNRIERNEINMENILSSENVMGKEVRLFGSLLRVGNALKIKVKAEELEASEDKGKREIIVYRGVMDGFVVCANENRKRHSVSVEWRICNSELGRVDVKQEVPRKSFVGQSACLCMLSHRYSSMCSIPEINPNCKLLVEARSPIPVNELALCENGEGLVVRQVLFWGKPEDERVYPGQIWQDRDARRADHQLVVEEVLGDEVDVRSLKTKLWRTINLERLAKKYRLVENRLLLGKRCLESEPEFDPAQ